MDRTAGLPRHRVMLGLQQIVLRWPGGDEPGSTLEKRDPATEPSSDSMSHGGGLFGSRTMILIPHHGSHRETRVELEHRARHPMTSRRKTMETIERTGKLEDYDLEANAGGEGETMAMMGQEGRTDGSPDPVVALRLAKKSNGGEASSAIYWRMGRFATLFLGMDNGSIVYCTVRR
nr:hypothetical protein CFP56_63495 [Quercus suber]